VHFQLRLPNSSSKCDITLEPASVDAGLFIWSITMNTDKYSALSRQVRRFDIGTSNLAQFSPSSKSSLLAHARQGSDTVKLIETTTGETIAKIAARSCTGLLFRPNPWLGFSQYTGEISVNELIIADDNQLRRYLPTVGAFLNPLQVPDPTAIACDTTGRFLACGNGAGEIYLFDLDHPNSASGQAVVEIRNLNIGALTGIAFVGNSLLALSNSGSGFTADLQFAACQTAFCATNLNCRQFCQAPALDLRNPLKNIAAFTLKLAADLNKYSPITFAAHPTFPQIALAAQWLLVCGLNGFQNSQYSLATTVRQIELLEFLPGNRIFVAGENAFEIHSAPLIDTSEAEDEPVESNFEKYGIKIGEDIPGLKKSLVYHLSLDAHTRIRAARQMGDTIAMACSYLRTR